MTNPQSEVVHVHYEITINLWQTIHVDKKQNRLPLCQLHLYAVKLAYKIAAINNEIRSYAGVF
jgi:hypothetical protein